MTLVIKGNKSYFEQAGSLDYAVNLEDAMHLPEGARNLLCAVGSNIAHAVSKVISIHIMEPGSVRFDAVKALVEQPGEDNTLSSGLDRDGHFVNGALRFTVDAARQRAYFAPSDALLDLCSFNPTRPSTSVPFPVTRVIRRDIRRQDPSRNGAFSTAVEVPAKTETDQHANGVLFTTFLSDSDYVYALGTDFSWVIATRYDLNGRFKRAFMVTPGFEWTPTQTGGQSIFTISQTIFLFCFVNLEVGRFLPPITPSYTLPSTRANPHTRRRVLLSTTANSGAGATAAQLSFETSPQTLLSKALGLTEDRVAVVGVPVSILLAHACSSASELNTHLSHTLSALFQQVASELVQVIVLCNTLDMRGQTCPSPASDDRRSFPQTLRPNGIPVVAAATEMMVASPPGATSHLDLELLESLSDVVAVAPIDTSPKISVGEVPQTARQPVGGGYGSDTRNKEEGSSDQMAMLAGAAGGGAALMR